MTRNKGFTLIELLITLVVAAILLMLGVPPMREMLRRNHFSQLQNDLSSALKAARSQAMLDSAGTQVCSLAAGKSGADVAMGNSSTLCGDMTDWGNGWLVVSGSAGAVVQFYDIKDANYSVSFSGNSGQILFNRQGVVQGAGAGSLSFTLSDVNKPDDAKTYLMDNFGRLSLQASAQDKSG
jgi:prepilin-type N-terminal cleavage/methylation domain-containing protein